MIITASSTLKKGGQKGVYGNKENKFRPHGLRLTMEAPRRAAKAKMLQGEKSCMIRHWICFSLLFYFFWLLCMECVG